MDLKNRGLISSVFEYAELPLSVLEDARIMRLHEAEQYAIQQKRRAKRGA